jgi:hypothetical protein
MNGVDWLCLVTALMCIASGYWEIVGNDIRAAAIDGAAVAVLLYILWSRRRRRMNLYDPETRLIAWLAARLHRLLGNPPMR